MRVVVTGIGVVSPFGVGRERFWQHVSRGCSGTRAISDFDASDFPCRVAAPVSGVTIDDLPAIAGDGGRDPEHRADPKRYSRAAMVGVIAAREAWNDAGLSAGEPGAGVIIGSGGGGIDVGERQYYDFFVEHGRKVTPYAIPISIVGMMSSEISISLRLRGVSHVLSCGCTSSTDAIGYAAALIRSGEAEVVLSGGPMRASRRG
jgi:3-oxoacyl-[acyl-carrier-protein] synthase II